MQMASQMNMVARNGGGAAGELPITYCQQPSQGDARLKALTAKLPGSGISQAPSDAGRMALADAAAPTGPHAPLALADAAAAVASGAFASGVGASGGANSAEDASKGTPNGKSGLSALTAHILIACQGMKDDRAEALWACMYL